MSKFLLTLLLLSPVMAQGVEDWINRALEPRLSPSDRLELLNRIVKEGGADALAARGLVPTLDAEVIHMVVDVLFKADKAIEHIKPIIRLLLSEDSMLRAKIARRIQHAGEHADKADALMVALDGIVAGEDPEASRDASLRVAAVRALRKIPQRRAVQSIVNAWMQDKQAAVLAECKLALRDVIVARTPEQAGNYLSRNLDLTYHDMRDEVIRRQRIQIEDLRGFRTAELARADAVRCFQVLRQSDDEARRIAADRLRQLSEKRAFGKLDPEAFAAQVFAIFKLERDRSQPPTVASLVLALKPLVIGAKAPLKTKEKLKALLQGLTPLAGRPVAWEKVGLASVDLLGSLGADAAPSLAEFARLSPSVDVRRNAVDKLGLLARQGTAMDDFVGRQLALLLEDEKDPAVRRALLFNLRTAPVKLAYKRIQELLDGGDLSETEIKYCIEFLRELGTSKALQSLLALAASQPKQELRMYAVREGLLQRKSDAKEGKIILAALGKILASEKEPVSFRLEVVKALGTHAGRDAYPLLVEVGKQEKLKKPATAARLQLAERLAKKPKDAEDLKVATVVLGERAGGDAVQLEKLAQAILASGKQYKLPVGNARYWSARLYGERQDRKPGELLRLYKQADEGAERDGLEAGLRVELLGGYKGLLLAGKPKPPALEEAIRCLQRLAVLAGDDQAKAIGYLLEAARIATDRLKVKATAESLLKAAEEKGAEATAVAELRKRVEALP